MGFNAFSPMFGAGPQRGRLPPLFYWLLGDGRGHEEEEARWKVIIGRRKEVKGTFWQREPRNLSLGRFFVPFMPSRGIMHLSKEYRPQASEECVVLLYYRGLCAGERGGER